MKRDDTEPDLTRPARRSGELRFDSLRALPLAVQATTSARSVSVWRAPLLKGLLVLAGLSILAFAGHGAVARTLPLDARDEPLSTGAELAPPTATLAPAVQTVVPVEALPRASPPPSAPARSLATSPTVDAGETARADAGAEGRIVLNEAGAADFEKLPGIGVKKAALVVALRQKLGRFHAVEDLLKVKGLGRKRLAKIRPLVTVDRP